LNLSQHLEIEGILLESEIIVKLERFASLLHEWNQIHNLTGAKSVDAIYINIVDSLYPLTFIKQPKTLLDVGTGAGFPGLVLAIAMPETKVVLAEPLKKRVSFLKYASIDLELSNVTVEAKRVENVVHDPFDLISSRAVTNTKLLLDLTSHISDGHTEYLFYKGSRVFDEIENNTIATYPMKGTIDAHLPNAKETILADEKEMAEHVMIVDLMRNDLGIIGSDIKVEKFRYVEKIKAGEKELLQVSSKITATLPSDWKENLGTLLDHILPAGSISGTPKKSTINIINHVENFDRDFYTGIFGVFDGASLRSGVMIRFIEKKNGQLFYKSGGGITIDSDAKSEHKELIDKIYLPLDP
jgi:16S rRNA (guanine527-N7)-methyltransferase